MSLPDLRADFAGRDEMAFWVHRAHYSRSLPASTLVGVGFRESGRSIGCVIFSRGASSEIHSPFGLQQSEVCELTRVAFGPHVTPTSRLVALAIKRLRKQSPNLRLLISFSDPMQHGPSGQPHVGTLYQALSFQFIGMTNAESLIRLNGRLFHPRTISSRYKTRSIDWLRAHVAADAAHVRTLPKYRYALPLDAAMRQQLAPRVQAYPKALVVERGRSTGSGARRAQAGVYLLAPTTRATCEGTLRNDPVAPVVHEAARRHGPEVVGVRVARRKTPDVKMLAGAWWLGIYELVRFFANPRFGGLVVDFVLKSRQRTSNHYRVVRQPTLTLRLAAAPRRAAPAARYDSNSQWLTAC